MNFYLNPGWRSLLNPNRKGNPTCDRLNQIKYKNHKALKNQKENEYGRHYIGGSKMIIGFITRRIIIH